MADPAPSTSSVSAPAPCCMPMACAACPCADRLAKVERTVGRLRLWLLVALGVLILLIGIAIGAGGARDDMRRAEAARGMPQGPGPMPPHQGPMEPGAGPQGPMAPPQGGWGPDAGFRRSGGRSGSR